MDFIFDLQRFATQTISAGESVTLDGVTYSAVDGDAVLNLDDDGKVSGLASGKVSAVVSGAESSPTVTFDATDSAITFTATSDGKVISITPFPIEFISGEFTYTSGRLDIAAGSDLAIVSQRGNFILRNQNHFDYDSTYTFTSTALTSDARRVISDFSLTNGTDVRQLQLEQLGTVINNFAQRGFTLVKGSSEVLHLGNYTLTATATNADAGLNMDLGENGLTFVPNTGDGNLTVTLARGDTTIFSGELECTSGSITLGYDHAVTFAKDTSFSFTTSNNSVLSITATDEATTAIALTDNGISFTPNTGDGALNVTYSKQGTQVFEGSLSISNGTIAFDATDKKFTISDGTKVALGIFGLELDIEVVGNTTVGSGIGANFKIDADANGNLIFTPDENGGSFNIALKREASSSENETRNVADDLETFFENNVTVNGPIMFNAQTGLLTLKDGTEVSLAFDNYTMTATAQGDAASKISLTASGISITPQQGDGTLKLTLGSAQGSMSVDVEVLSGGFVFGENGALNVVEGTELQLKFSDDYIVKFKTTDDAGGALSIGADGLTFTPNSEDGGLQLSVTRNGETRTASLDVTGSLTYKLDGSISLTEGTVVKNVFEDGNILTITANTDASGSIVFNPSTGLTITPSTADALTVALTTGDLEVAQFSSITGSINYSGGLVTASDGTQANLLVYDTWETKLSTSGGTASLQFTDDRTVYTANTGATFVLDYLDGSTVEIQNGTYTDIYATETSDAIELISEGSNFKCNDDEFVFTLETAGNYTLNGISVTTTSDNVEVQLSNYDTVNVDGISYTPLDENVALTIGETGATVSGGKVSMQMDSFDKVATFDTTDGSISYDSTTGKFTIAQGTKSYIGNGEFPDQFVAQGDFEISVVKNSDGTFTFSSDDTAAVAIERNGNIIMSTTITLDGSIIADPANNQITLPKDTTVTMTPGDGKILEIKALDDAGGHLSLVDGGIRFAPNENDGALELNFVNSGRKVQLDVTGAFTYKGLGALSLEDGTEATFTWEDGNILKLTSSGSTGSIGLDPNLGLKITSDDENLSMTFSTSSMSTDISGIKGTIYYNAGVVSFDENSTITATTTLGGQPIYTTLETIDGTGHISFNTTNGVLYSADTGALRITWTRDDLESTFTVNSGSVQIGHNLFRITEGSDIVTDLKTFVPALYFTTGDVGNYTINGQTITTTAEGLSLTATDDQMVFVTSDDNAVEYDGMNFAGAGNVTLNPSSVVLGAGVEATGFKEGNTFMLAEAGNVTADAKIFELTELDTEIEIPMEISVKGAQDGFIFSRTLTKESEAYIDDALNEEDFGNYSSSYIGQVFTEKFISAGDSSYRIRTDAIGLEEVIGISDGATVTGGASLGDEPTLSYYNIVTDTEGAFTIGEKTYNVSGDSSVAIRARFEADGASYASAVDSLNGTISGDFSGGAFKVNGSSSLQVFGDSSIEIIADENGFEIVGLDAGASLKVSAADTYTVNGTEIAAGASAVIVGTEEGKAQEMSNKSDIEILAETILKRTEAGYPAMAAAVFDPEGNYGDEPTNYADKEDWTITSADDLKLHAVHYTPENSNDKWVILIHGYGNNHTAMYTYAASYLANGYNVLMIDQRAAGESEGTWLTMGAAESADVALWTQEIASRNSNAKITLHGVSMGAATAMLAAARSDAKNITSIVEDCGYSNVLETFSEIVTNTPQLGISPTVVPYLDPVAQSLTGYYLHDAAPIDSISSVKMPSLFISGDADSVAPVSMLDELYDASGAEVKEKFIVEDAAHALAVFDDSIGYNNAVFRFVAEADEEGWVTTNTTDGISLRGTKYGDSITNKGTSVTIDADDGNDYIENNVDSSLVAASLGNSINAGNGDDTIYSFHTYNPTLLGGAGADSIVVSHGHLTYIDGGADNDSILGIAPDDGEHEDYWGMGGYATVLGGEGDDYIDTGYSNNSSLDGGDGNDTIIASGKSATINGGAGENLIRVTSVVADTGEYIVLAGNTTVEGFKTGFGEGADSLYITGDPAVDFKEGGLTFYENNGNDILTLSDVIETEKVYLYYAPINWSRKGVFIPDDTWYTVESSDFTDSSDEGLYLVGTSSSPNHGADFSGISTALNITMDTDYDATDNSLWVNNIYSLKGGAGNTTITGSDKDDTIIAGSGSTTINAGAGENLVNLEDAASARIQLAGNTTLEGFKTGFGDGTDTIYIDGDPAGVYFKDGVLTFANSTDSLTLSDITTTAKVNIYHERRTMLNKGVFIAAGDWYKVEESDLTVDAGEEVYFVGTAADPKAGVDFSGISSALNVTMDTAYIDSEDYVPGTTTWINGVYSLKGGAGNTTITGSKNSDTIIAGSGSTTIDAGAGNNLVNVEDAASALVHLAGNTTVEGFKTGFGDGTDTIYIDGDPAGVYFKDGVLAFGNSTDSLTLSDVTTTAKVNIYHERRQMLNKGVFIAAGDWYKVEESDLTVDAGEEVYFVGTAADPKAGVDFSGISSALNVTMDTAYIDSEDYVPGTTTWINGVYSLKGGAGLTTITGSKNSDTIIAGTGETTINASAGDDVISLGSASALVIYNADDGNDLIQGFNENSTLQIGDGNETYSTSRSGSDVIVTTGDAEITLEGAASLNSRHINGKFYVSPEALEKRIGVNPVATYTDEDFTNGTLDLTKSEGSQEVSLESGNQSVKFNNDGGNVAVVEDGSGTKTIALGNGGDAVISYANKGQRSSVNVVGGKGDDTIYTFGTAPVTFDMKNGGKDKISSRFNGETITLKNYKASLGGGIASGNYNTQEIVADIISENQMTFGDNEVELENNNGGSAKFVFDSNIFNMFDANGEAQKIGFTNSDGGKLDVSKARDDYLLVGNYYGGKESSTITGGKGNDTLLGGGGDVLNAGAGKNLILLQDDANRDGASIILKDGKTTVQNFKAGFDDDSDRIFFGVNDVIDFKFDGANVSVNNNNAWRGVLSEIGDGAEFVNILTADANGSVKVAVAQEDAVITVEDELADFYVGKNSGVDFTSYDGELMANLGSEKTSLGTGEIMFNGINQITAGSGRTTLMGSAKNETLTAGTGTASIYGGGGRNFLANSSAEKDGATTFFVLGDADGARNTIDGFAFVTEDGIADKIEINTATNLVSDVRTSGDNVIIEVSNRAGTATERAVINGAVGQNMLFSDNVVAQVNRTALTYDGTANYFVATDSNAAVNVSADFANKAIIWLDTPEWAGTKENTFVGDIRTIDATASAVKAELAGNDANNTISAGSGDTSLWGGNGGDDLLIGGAGRDNFYYTYGNGNDTVSGTAQGDTVFLTQVAIDQITGASVQNNVATITFSDGGQLTVQDATNANYVVTQGEEMRTYRIENGGFVQN